jgi:hypothetical protein
LYESVSDVKSQRVRVSGRNRLGCSENCKESDRNG